MFLRAGFPSYMLHYNRKKHIKFTLSRHLAVHNIPWVIENNLLWKYRLCRKSIFDISILHVYIENVKWKRIPANGFFYHYLWSDSKNTINSFLGSQRLHPFRRRLISPVQRHLVIGTRLFIFPIYLEPDAQIVSCLERTAADYSFMFRDFSDLQAAPVGKLDLSLFVCMCV